MIAVKRFVLFGLVWLALTGAAPSGLLVGLLTATVSTALSLRLLPPGGRRVDLIKVLRLAPGFLWRSLLGGIDVAWRAFHPRMPLRTGWLIHASRLPPGARVSLGNDISLLPGTLVAGSRGDRLYIHCLDVGADVAAQIAHEEERIGSVLVPEDRDA